MASSPWKVIAVHCDMSACYASMQSWSKRNLLSTAATVRKYVQVLVELALLSLLASDKQVAAKGTTSSSLLNCLLSKLNSFGQRGKFPWRQLLCLRLIKAEELARQVLPQQQLCWLKLTKQAPLVQHAQHCVPYHEQVQQILVTVC